jgi:putative transposase
MDIMGNKRRRHTPEQIIRKLAEGHKLLAGGRDLEDVSRHLEIAESTWHRWLAQYGPARRGRKANDAKHTAAHSPHRPNQEPVPGRAVQGQGP